MNQPNETARYSKITVISVIICAIVFVCAVISFFLLPEKIFVQIMANSSTPETSTSIFLIAGVLIVGLASLMCILSENSKKWLATQSVLAIAVVGCLVYNYVVLIP